MQFSFIQFSSFSPSPAKYLHESPKANNDISCGHINLKAPHAHLP